ncbi:MAG: sigma-70 family RNA polymerase sigma factor [Anaerolineae bacterium]|nr:sigma-70 family RNA polymerase sigma factor [Anaerolineae bacterium]
MMHPQLDDIELMRRIAANDQQAFRAIYQQYGKAIYSLAYHVLQNTTWAEEVTQDTFLKVWQQKTQWDPNKGNLRNWLLRITHFTAIDRLRQERRQPNLHPDAIEEVEDEIPASLRDSAWQDGIVLQMLVKQLPREQAFLIDLAFFRGMTHAEIADETHMPLGTVKTRLRNGLQRLRELWLESLKQTSSRS